MRQTNLLAGALSSTSRQVLQLQVGEHLVVPHHFDLTAARRHKPEACFVRRGHGNAALILRLPDPEPAQKTIVGGAP